MSEEFESEVEEIVEADFTEDQIEEVSEDAPSQDDITNLTDEQLDETLAALEAFLVA